MIFPLLHLAVEGRGFTTNVFRYRKILFFPIFFPIYNFHNLLPNSTFLSICFFLLHIIDWQGDQRITLIFKWSWQNYSLEKKIYLYTNNCNLLHNLDATEVQIVTKEKTQSYKKNTIIWVFNHFTTLGYICNLKPLNSNGVIIC